MLLDLNPHSLCRNASSNSTPSSDEFSQIWNIITLTLYSSNVLTCGFNTVVVSYLTYVSRRAFLPFLLYCAFNFVANILAFPDTVYMAYFPTKINKVVFFSIYVTGYIADVLYGAASYQLLYIYLERFLRMHYPFRFRFLPTAWQQILASLVNITIVALSNAGIIYFMVKGYSDEPKNNQVIEDNWTFSQKYPVYRSLNILGDVVTFLVPAVGICVLAKINTQKLAAVAIFNQTAGCWNRRFGRIMSMEAWIHKEVRLCTSLAMLHVFIFVPSAVVTIAYNAEKTDLSVSEAYDITTTVIRVVQLAGISAHTAVFVAFCPAYRQAVFNALQAIRASLRLRRNEPAIIVERL